MRRLSLSAAGASALLLVACSSSVQSVPMDGSASTGGPCQAFDEHTSESAPRTVSFGGQAGSGPFSYSPMCMQIAKGQSVVFSGDFSVHPLAPGDAPGQPASASAESPITPMSSGTAPISVRFPSAGLYPYYCMQHYAAGMVGAIEVRE